MKQRPDRKARQTTDQGRVPPVDPRVTMAIALYLSLSVVAFRDARMLTPLLALALLAAALLYVSLGSLLRRLKRLWQVVIVVALMQSVFAPSGAPLIAIGRFSLLSAGGLLTGVAVLERMAVLMLGGGMLAAHGNRALVQAMIQLHAPYEFAYMVSVGLRFVPMMAQSLRDSLTALELRGVEFDRLKLRRRLRVYAYLLLPSVASGLTNARRLAMSMEMRGFRAHPTRTSFYALRWTRRDGAVLAVVALLACATLAAGIWMGRVGT